MMQPFHANHSVCFIVVTRGGRVLQGRMEAHWLDEMERVGMWRSEAMAAVVFPNAETLSELRSLEASQQRLLLMFNPQWQTTGQLLSDFGCVSSLAINVACSQSFFATYRLRSCF